MNSIPERYTEACKLIIGNDRRSSGIGTLGEKTLHAVLKYTFEPDESKHEVKVGRYVADIFGDEGVIEIQTGSLGALRKKLECFLDVTKVLVVYPVIRAKWLVWIDPKTGEVTKRRKSPKTGRVYDAFKELYRIKQLLPGDGPGNDTGDGLIICGLRICLLMVDVVEYRRLTGWSEDRKKGSSRAERIPLELGELIYIGTGHGYGGLLPEGLGDEFGSKEFAKCSGLNRRNAGIALNVLRYLGTVLPVGKEGNAVRYRKV